MKLKYDFATRDMGGTYVALTIGKGSQEYHNIIALNETGHAIFNLLKDGNDEDEVVKKMMEEYDVTEEKLRPEVQALIQKLKNEGLVVEE